MYVILNIDAHEQKQMFIYAEKLDFTNIEQWTFLAELTIGFGPMLSPFGISH